MLAIAAVHEVLMERREEEVELADLVDRLRAMLVQGLASGKTVESALEPVQLSGDRATALALVFSELLQNALEHGGSSVSVELGVANGDVVLSISDDGAGIAGEPETRHRPLDRQRAREGRARRHARAGLERRGPARRRDLPGLDDCVAAAAAAAKRPPLGAKRSRIRVSGFATCASTLG